MSWGQAGCGEQGGQGDMGKEGGGEEGDMVSRGEPISAECEVSRERGAGDNQVIRHTFASAAMSTASAATRFLAAATCVHESRG